MSTPAEDVTVTPYVDALLECLRTQTARLANPPAVVCVRPGARVDLLLSTVRDECCEGLAWVRVAGVYPSRDFPAPDADAVSCGPYQWAVVLEMGVARCAPTTDTKTIPTCDQWSALHYQVMNDAAALRRTLCCFIAADLDRLYLPGQWAPLDVEGGCAGGTMQVTIAVPACDCQEDAS